MAVFAVVATHSTSLEELKTPRQAGRGRYSSVRQRATLRELKEEDEEDEDEEMGFHEAEGFELDDQEVGFVSDCDEEDTCQDE